MKVTVLVNSDSGSAIYMAICADAKYLMSESLYMCCLFCSFTERAAERPAASACRWGREAAWKTCEFVTTGAASTKLIDAKAAGTT